MLSGTSIETEPTSTKPITAVSTVFWRGIGKVVEEAGEVLQIAGKAMAFPTDPHPDGKGPLRDRFIMELGDLLASLDYLSEMNELSVMGITAHHTAKLPLLRSCPIATQSSEQWIGLQYVIQEAGAILQVASEAIAYPAIPHPDGKGPLRDRMVKRIGHLKAAIYFLCELNVLPNEDIAGRRELKLTLFRSWGLSGIPEHPPQSCPNHDPHHVS